MYLRQTALDTKKYIRQVALCTKRYLGQVALFPSGMLILVWIIYDKLILSPILLKNEGTVPKHNFILNMITDLQKQGNFSRHHS